MADNNKLLEHLKEYEGYKEKVYPDSNENPTIGYGTNLRAPGLENYLKQINKTRMGLMEGAESLNPEEAEFLMKKQIEDAQKTFEGIQQKDFPQTQLTEDQLAALTSLTYNNPKLIGPQLRQFLSEDNREEAIKEILLRSNRAKDPGIMRRRLAEAEMYAGQNPLKMLSEDELEELKIIASNIESPGTRQGLLDMYPSLKDIESNNSRFLKTKRFFREPR